MSIKSLARRFLAWIGHPVALLRMPVTTKPTSMHEAELMLTALARLREIIKDGRWKYMCIGLAFMADDEVPGKTDVQRRLRDDINNALGDASSVEWLIREWFWYEPSWSCAHTRDLAKQVRLKWIDETIDAVVEYMLEQTYQYQGVQALTAPPATAQE